MIATGTGVRFNANATGVVLTCSGMAQPARAEPDDELELQGCPLNAQREPRKCQWNAVPVRAVSTNCVPSHIHELLPALLTGRAGFDHGKYKTTILWLNEHDNWVFHHGKTFELRCTSLSHTEASLDIAPGF